MYLDQIAQKVWAEVVGSKQQIISRDRKEAAETQQEQPWNERELRIAEILTQQFEKALQMQPAISSHKEALSLRRDQINEATQGSFSARPF